MKRTAFRDLLSVSLPTIIVILGLMELVFRFVLPGRAVPYRVWDEEDQILKYDVNGPRTGVTTIGPLARQRCRWHINNCGWNSDVDYQMTGRSKPLIAIIGDSYIESFQVDTGRSVTGILRNLVGSDYEVYGFGMSGASLSTYLQMARYVSKRFEPSILVITVVHNDLHQSICAYSQLNGLCFRLKDNYVIEATKIVPTPFHEKAYRVMATSGLVRYLRANLLQNVQFGPILSRLPIICNRMPAYTANIDPAMVLKSKDEIEKVLNYGLNALVQEHPGVPIVVMVDAPRPDIYSGDPELSRVYWMNKLVARECFQLGICFLDLTGLFSSQFRAKGTKFESEWDQHWNENGHRAAARALFNKLTECGLLGNRRNRVNAGR